eukprot:SAG31_NODE_10973_length_1077_cov_1.281186_2_plen_101_part_00
MHMVARRARHHSISMLMMQARGRLALCHTRPGFKCQMRRRRPCIARCDPRADGGRRRETLLRSEAGARYDCVDRSAAQLDLAVWYIASGELWASLAHIRR